MGDLPRRILTVSELTFLVRDRIEQSFPDFWVEGEVSTLRAPASGHLYFTLKDATSQIRAVLFRGSAQRLRFALREGLHVIVRGRLTVYEPRGEYQVVLEYVEPKGVGALQIAFEQLKAKLAAEGLFEEARKRPLPLLPRRVGLVTSLSGAAIRDMLTVLHRRCPILGVVIAPVPVQGDGAAERIAQGIRMLGESGLVDLMIVGRGGGSLEDLWAFNEEVVVRAIAASPVPVVSAVGHEIDYTLVDFVADLRAPTPSAAAEAVAPVLEDLVRAIWDSRSRMVRAMRTLVERGRDRARDYARGVPALRLAVQRSAQRLDDAVGRVAMELVQRLGALHRRILVAQHGLNLVNPLARIQTHLVLLPQLFKRVEQGMLAVLAMRRQAVREVAHALDSLSPLAVLARGYSILQTVPEGRVVRRADEVEMGDELRARLGEGQLLCRVREIVRG